MNAPPRQVADQLRQLTEHVTPPEEPSDLMPVRQDSRALAQSPESLPVLDAFRDFIEGERRRTRRRMRAMAASFIVVLVLVVAGGLAVIQSHLSEISKDYGVIREALEKDAALFDHRTAEAVLRVGQTAEKTQQAMLRAEQTAKNLRADLDRQSEALSSAEGNFGTQLGMQSNTLEQMHALLAILQTENATLRTHLQVFRSGLPSLTNEMAAVRAVIADLRSLPVRPIRLVEQPVGPLAATSPEQATANEDPHEAAAPGKQIIAAALPPTENLSLLIVPRGGKRPARWQFRVPSLRPAPLPAGIGNE